MTLQLTNIIYSVANIKHPYLRVTVSRAYCKIASFANPYTPVAPAIDLKAAYDAKNGAPTAAAPKVFFKWFYVK